MLVLRPCRCRDCGHVFPHKSGGFILMLSAPQCPKCGSKKVERIKESK